jgi:NADH pyrophosphatase NudC (nudix superfamily)
MSDFKFCPHCASPLAWSERQEDGGPKLRNACTACDFTHWNNPTPVLAAIVQWNEQIVLARNAAWPAGRYALITGFMEAGEDPEEGIRREIFEETHLQTTELSLVGVYEFIKKNQVIIAYHAKAHGHIELSAELVDYRLYDPKDIICWPAGTGYAVADWQRNMGIEPVFKSWEERGS